MVDGEHQRMPSNDASDKTPDKPQEPPTVQRAAVPRSRSVAPPISQLGLPDVRPERLPAVRLEQDLKPLLFDQEWYLQQNQDVAKARLDPVQHYLDHGAAEGRNPNALFDTKAYLAANADVRGSPLNPFLHFVLYGFREGRDPSPPPKTTGNKAEVAAPREMVVPAPPEPPIEENLRQTLLSAMFTAAAEVSGNDNRKDDVPIVSAKDPLKPSPRSRPGARKRP